MVITVFFRFDELKQPLRRTFSLFGSRTQSIFDNWTLSVLMLGYYKRV
jgi:hypothetical protein